MNPIIGATTIDYGKKASVSLWNMAMPPSSVMAKAMRILTLVVKVFLDSAILADRSRPPVSLCFSRL